MRALRRRLVAVAAAWLCLWAPLAHAQGLAGFLSPGPLAEPHAEYDSITQCTRCHQAGRGVSATKCLACHDTVKAQVTSKRGFHADKGETCQPCHLDHRGRDYSMTELDESDFDHAATGFALRGGHAPLRCADCHAAGKWTGLRPACASCHEDPHHDHDRAVGGAGGGGSTRALAAGCTSCHSDRTWKALPLALAVFDHNLPGQAAFALQGAHAEVACEECHAKWVFVPTAHDACTTCHKDPHRAPFSNDCATCHQVRADWRVPRFDHAVTGYRLLGVHKDVACRACHTRGVVRPLAHAACEDCHRDPHRGQFAPRTCDACHSVNRKGFALTDFDHAAVGWPLEGRHAETSCASCHGEGPEASYAAVSRECASCHDDPHTGRFGAACGDCHTPAEWLVDDFDHGRTAFPLTGAHAEVPCTECHEPHVYAGVAHDSCLDCHTDLPHDTSVAAASCDGCHVTARWDTVEFDHASATSFPLAPQHSRAPCRSCHGLEHFGGLNATCEQCHLEDRPPSHFEGSCNDCHRSALWQPADLGPLGHDVTGFPLVGSHLRLACASCHPPGQLASSAVPECIACHATDDVHRNMLGNVCGECHTETVWARTRWRHQLTGWPLRGAHRLAACDDCHAGGYVGTPSDCRSCHLAEAPLTVPAHASAFFDDCAACHKPFTWASSGFPH